MRIALATKTPGSDKTQPHSPVRKRHQAATETPIPQAGSDPEAEIVTQSDPTDNALAAIASILDQPEAHREPERPAVTAEKPALHPPIEAHGYTRHGPGPMAAIRFKWTVRLDNGDYYVDETIGENSSPLVTGPMSREAAIQMVDDRESDARRRFEQLKSEMTGRGAAANLVRKDSGEA